ncbi:MAG: HAMP domain-containing sensor histidine kinase [Hyphomicrobiales bacterium]|nr:HAMP domain-containing sensor histidine kinase [Hyphomicrobiales bacterium]
MNGAAQHSSEELLSSARRLADADLMAFAWLDDALVARWRYGRLADWIPLGEPICAATPAFIGLETDLLSLQDEPAGVVALPKIGFGGAPGPQAKISVEAFWLPEAERYLLVISRLGAPVEVEFELAKQVRARRIAEDNYRRAQQEMTERRRLLDIIAEDAPAALAVVDERKRLLFATRRWAELTQPGLDAPTGQGLDAAISGFGPEARAAVDAALNGAPAVAPPVAPEWSRAQQARLRFAPWRKPGGAIGGAIVAADIVTPEAETIARLEAEIAALRSRNAVLDDFAAIVAHDLSAPLRAAERCLQRDAASTAEALGHVRRVGDMLDALADWCRYGAGAAGREPVDLPHLVARIAADTPGADRFRFEVRAEEAIDAPTAPIEIALRNLIGNAVKHHDRGEGEIAVSAESDGEAWIITVADDGPGVAADEEAALFAMFQRPLASRGKPGLGAGLALARRSVEAAGGALTLKRRDGARGAAFVVRLPRPATARQPSTQTGGTS